MLPRREIDSALYIHGGVTHFNVLFTGGALHADVRAIYFKGCKPDEIEWIWIREEHRRCTELEIRQLCIGIWKGRQKRLR
jgi:hypothetical protein